MNYWSVVDDPSHYYAIIACDFHLGWNLSVGTRVKASGECVLGTYNDEQVLHLGII